MNNNKYLPILQLALKEAISNGDTWKPQGLLNTLAKNNNPLEYVANRGWECNQLFEVMDKDFGFIQHARFGYVLTQDEYKRLIDILRWVRGAIERFEFTDDKTLVAVLLVAIQLADGRTFWREITFKRRPTKFLKKLHWLLGRFECKFTMRSAHPPIWEAEAISAFEKANQSSDFIQLETTWRQISGALLPSLIQQTAAVCLLYHDSHKLLDVSHKIKDVVIAAHTISALPTGQMLFLAATSDSYWIKFAALFVLCDERARGNRKILSRQSESFLADLIMSISRNEEYWRQFVIAFNRYPSRYPFLHTSLGHALARLGELHWKTYLASFKATDSHARASVSRCLEAFYERACLYARNQFFAMVYAKWADEVLSKQDKQHHFDLFLTALDFGVVVYLVEQSTVAFLERQIVGIRQSIAELEHVWYPSLTEAISAYNRLVSLLQVYYHALDVVTQGKDFLFEKFFVPLDIYENRYLSVSFPSTWHKRN